MGGLILFGRGLISLNVWRRERKTMGLPDKRGRKTDKMKYWEDKKQEGEKLFYKVHSCPISAYITAIVFSTRNRRILGSVARI